MSQLLWGIDLGGTKIEGVVLRDDGQVLSRQRVPTERDKGYDHIISWRPHGRAFVIHDRKALTSVVMPK